MKTPPAPLSKVLSEKQEKWLGHILRAEYMTADGARKPRAVNTYALWEPNEGHGKRNPGRPFTSFLKAYQQHRVTEDSETFLRRLAQARSI